MTPLGTKSTRVAGLRELGVPVTFTLNVTLDIYKRFERIKLLGFNPGTSHHT